MKYKRGDFCIIKKSGKFVEGTVVKLVKPYHGIHYYMEGDTRYFVTENKIVKSPSFGIINKSDMIKTYSESELISWERECKINQLGI